jgi:diadenosine tetraphosphate (Ap4A) HIT family hydrolase
MRPEQISLSPLDCAFCDKFADESSPYRHWYDVSLYSTPDVVVVPGLGASEAGYVLIVPRSHYTSLACLPSPALDDIRAAKGLVDEVLSVCFRRPVFFEHGPGDAAIGAGGCIEHAHLHALPTEIDLLALLEQRHPLNPCGDLAHLGALRTTSYIYVEQASRGFVLTPPASVPGQYVRRLLAAAQGTPDQWDYALFPNYAAVESTIEKLSPWPAVGAGSAATSAAAK